MAGQTRRKQSQDIPVPDISEDAAERKRVLNVLAQRRYRRRKRDRLQALESQVNAKDTTNIENLAGLPHDVNLSDVRLENLAPPLDEPGDLAPPIELAHRAPSTNSRLSVSGYLDLSFTAFPSDIAAPDDSLDPSETLWNASINTTSKPSSSSQDHPTSPPDFDFTSFIPCNFPSPSSITPSTSSGGNLYFSNTPSDLSASLQERQTSTFSFPDDYLLSVLELDLLRAALDIAKRIGCDQLVWNLESVSPFFGAPPPYTEPSNPTGSTSPLPLPPNLIPTRAQRCIPHHPILDCLPWPTARDKLINVFAQPVEIRPPVAQDPMSIVQLVYDMEDSAEGIRIWGSDPTDGNGWEVGQVFFERWWWALDFDIVQKSNEWRLARGALKLKLPGSSPPETTGANEQGMPPILIG